jgi:hypothetical protein
MTARLLAVTGAVGGGPAFPTGCVDPEPNLKAAEAAIGADRVRCITMSGTGYAGIAGQQRLAESTSTGPAASPLANYTRTMDWETRTMVEEFHGSRA